MDQLFCSWCYESFHHVAPPHGLTKTFPWVSIYGFSREDVGWSAVSWYFSTTALLTAPDFHREKNSRHLYPCVTLPHPQTLHNRDISTTRTNIHWIKEQMHIAASIFPDLPKYIPNGGMNCTLPTHQTTVWLSLCSPDSRKPSKGFCWMSQTYCRPLSKHVYSSLSFFLRCTSMARIKTSKLSFQVAV